MTICLKATVRCDTDATYKQSLCPNDFFCSLPSGLIQIISGGYTQCDFYRIFSTAMICLLPSKTLRIRRWYSTGEFVTQMESRRIIILEIKFFIFRKYTGKTFENMSTIFFFLFGYFADQTKMTSKIRKIAIKQVL